MTWMMRDYQCVDCGAVQEFLSSSEDEPVFCEACDSGMRMEPILSPVKGWVHDGLGADRISIPQGRSSPPPPGCKSTLTPRIERQLSKKGL